ncbi:MAG: V-type ATP synthase subunit K [Candidatus Aenigmarchaeota archaeon]|nr:V-type ATP synthase subunit K [Candidatus Aenigmarchaeota archaeon]
MVSQAGWIAIGSGLAIGLSAIATAIAEAAIGSAAVASFTEKEELFGKALILTVIPETILIIGFVVSILQIFMLAGGGE